MEKMMVFKKEKEEEGKKEVITNILEDEKERVIPGLREELLHPYVLENLEGVLKGIEFYVKGAEEKVDELEKEWSDAVCAHDDKKLDNFFRVESKIKKEINDPSYAESKMFQYADHHEIKNAEDDFDVIINNAQIFSYTTNKYLKKEEERGIKYFISRNIGPYILHIKARDALHILRGEKEANFINFIKSKGAFQEAPVSIDKDHHALIEDNTIRLSKKNGFDPIEEVERKSERKYFDAMVGPTGSEYKEAIKKMDWSALRRESLVITGKAYKDEGDFQKDIHDFTYLYGAYARQQIQKDFHYDPTKLSLHEQFYFVNFIKNKEYEAVAPIQQFVRVFGEDGLRTFLALDFDRNLGDTIISLGNHLEESAAQAIFTKFGEIADAKENLTQYLQENFDKETTLNPAIIAQITESLINKGRDILVHFSDQLKEEEQKGRIPNTTSILTELNDIKTDVILFTSAFKTLKQEGESLDFNEIKHLDFETASGSELSPNDITRMHAMYEQNYKLKPELKETLLKVFDASLVNPDSQLYTLRYKGDVISFVRFDRKDDQHLYAGSLNVDPHFRGSEIGRAVMEQTLDMKAKEAVLEADCSATDAVGAHYIETGFVATKFHDYAGAPSFVIERNDLMVYDTKQMSRQELVAQAQSAHEQPSGTDRVVITGAHKTPTDLGFDLLDEGYALTRYFTDDGAWYVAYEKRKEELAMAA